MKSVYEQATGRLTGVTICGGESAVAQNTPEGCGVVDGQHDHLSKRVDLATGQVVDWRPPAPPDTDTIRHEWNTDIRRWTMRLTASAIERQRQQAIIDQITSLEAKQARPIRELAIDPGDDAAHDRLSALEREIEALRRQL